ncbi:hypothetical protein COLO4_14389 [Corchorus olitorius]|uniref:Uncharacterized protein n=1 Tax=Corchorus olitorius TaxID=93759 RepID=A0A1R3JST6_9ROSI|nr:hypothetical protein COLO4_14389 [Corchorus olitorius]
MDYCGGGRGRKTNTQKGPRLARGLYVSKSEPS